jgi:uncharacterized membrane protein YdbT with pleckstrin-like domain
LDRTEWPRDEVEISVVALRPDRTWSVEIPATGRLRPRWTPCRSDPPAIPWPAMGFPKRLLAEHEDLVLDLRPHWIALVGPGLVLVLLIVALVVLFANFDPPSAVAWLSLAAGAVLLIVYPIRAFLAWVTSHFVVTTDRVIHRSGWLAKRSMEMPLERINDVTFTQTVLERVVGAGSLRIQSGSEYGQNHFRDIRKPEDVQKLIYEQSEANEARMRSGDVSRQATTETFDIDDGSPLDEIERLARLKERGILSEEEFETQKRRLLGRL